LGHNEFLARGRSEATSLWDDGVPTAQERDVVDWLLTTTRANRRTLDLHRPVDVDVVEECLRLALQAPAAHNEQRWHWFVVTDADKRKAIADVYARAWAAGTHAERPRVRRFRSASRTGERTQDSAQWLSEHLHEVPMFVIPCMVGPRPTDPVVTQEWERVMSKGGMPEADSTPVSTAYFGSIYPAVWSFQLALRSRGLGSVMTVMHLAGEQEVADLLRIPANVAQLGLLPVAHLTKTAFKPAARASLESRMSWNTWSEARR
jgi:nitroreductase